MNPAPSGDEWLNAGDKFNVLQDWDNEWGFNILGWGAERRSRGLASSGILNQCLRFTTYLKETVALCVEGWNLFWM